jgi:hypothetical protein
MLARDLERIANLNNIFNYNDVEALQICRMNQTPFFALVRRFRATRLLVDNLHTFVEEHLAMFLLVVSHNQRFRVIHNTFRRSRETYEDTHQSKVDAIFQGDNLHSIFIA